MENYDDIVREMINLAHIDKESDEKIPRKHMASALYGYAHRIDVAVKALVEDRDNWRKQALEEDARANATHKDSLAVRNRAAMREALHIVVDSLKSLSAIRALKFPKEVKSALGNMAFHAVTALEKPPRNCDVHSTKDQRQSAFINWHNETFDLKDSKYAIDICDIKHNIDDILHEYIDWLFTEAKGKE